MSRFAHFRDFSRDEIIQTSYEVLAIMHLCERASREDNYDSRCAGAIAQVLNLALELHGLVHDTLEMHEGPA